MKKVPTVTIDGIRYHASRPADCRDCFFWKNRKKGCVLGKENCYYLIEPPKGPSKCEGWALGKMGYIAIQSTDEGWDYTLSTKFLPPAGGVHILFYFGV